MLQEKIMPQHALIIHENPVKAGLVLSQIGYEYSSANDYVGMREETICNFVSCVILCITFVIMIKSFRHKGLKLYYENGIGSKLPKELLIKISRILTVLDAVSSDSDITQMGMGIHKLRGELKGFWSVSVTGNYRIIFRFDHPDIVDIEFIDYH